MKLAFASKFVETVGVHLGEFGLSFVLAFSCFFLCTGCLSVEGRPPVINEYTLFAHCDRDLGYQLDLELDILKMCLQTKNVNVLVKAFKSYSINRTDTQTRPNALPRRIRWW